MLRRKIVVYVDVDDTLVRSAGAKRIPIPAMGEHVKRLYEEGVTLYCWSSGGSEYCHEVCSELGIEHCFVGFLPKPDVLIDDMAVSDWRTLVEVHPNTAVSKTGDDYLQLVSERFGFPPEQVTPKS